MDKERELKKQVIARLESANIHQKRKISRIRASSAFVQGSMLHPRPVPKSGKPTLEYNRNITARMRMGGLMKDRDIRQYVYSGLTATHEFRTK